MTRNTWTTVVSAIVFVALALAVSLWHVPFVTWGPGETLDLLGSNDKGAPAVEVKAARTHPTTGELRMTTVSVTRADSHLALPEALLGWFQPRHDVLPREVIYPRTMTVDDVNREQVAEMDAAKSDAVVAALREAGIPVRQLPMVQSVSMAGPAYQKLVPGDLVQRVDQTAVRSPDDVDRIVARHSVGDPVVFSVLRAGASRDVTITVVASNQRKEVPTDGVHITVGHQYAPVVSYGIDPDVVGPSAGLVFSLGIYDKLTPGALLNGRSVAGTGTIDAQGRVGGIGGIQEKIAGAQKAGATVFLVPSGNCVDLAGVSTTMTLVRVGSLHDAVQAMQALAAGRPTPHC